MNTTTHNALRRRRIDKAKGAVPLFPDGPLEVLSLEPPENSPVSGVDDLRTLEAGAWTMLGRLVEKPDLFSDSTEARCPSCKKVHRMAGSVAWRIAAVMAGSYYSFAVAKAFVSDAGSRDAVSPMPAGGQKPVTNFRGSDDRCPEVRLLAQLLSIFRSGVACTRIALDMRQSQVPAATNWAAELESIAHGFMRSLTIAIRNRPDETFL